MRQDQATLEPEVRLAPSRYITIALAAAITGFSPGAIRTKIARGVWIEGREYLRASDGHVMIDLRGYEKWVGRAAQRFEATRSGSSTRRMGLRRSTRCWSTATRCLPRQRTSSTRCGLPARSEIGSGTEPSASANISRRPAPPGWRSPCPSSSTPGWLHNASRRVPEQAMRAPASSGSLRSATSLCAPSSTAMCSPRWQSTRRCLAKPSTTM